MPHQIINMTEKIESKLRNILVLMGLNIQDYYDKLKIYNESTGVPRKEDTTYLYETTIYNDFTEELNVTTKVMHSSESYLDKFLSTNEVVNLTFSALNSTTISTTFPMPEETTTGHINQKSDASNCSSELILTALHIYSYGVIFLVVAALLLNCLQFIIFYSPTLRQYGFAVYFRALSVVDIVSLCGYIPRKWISLVYKMLEWDNSAILYQSSSLACKSIEYISSVSQFTSAWLVVLLACDRLSAVYNPFKTRGRQTAYKTFAACVIISLLYHAHTPLTWGIIQNKPANNLRNSTFTSDRYKCNIIVESRSLMLSFMVLSLCGNIGVPLVVTVIVTMMLYRGLSRWKIKPRRMKPEVLCRAMMEKRAAVMVCGICTFYCVLSVPYVFTSTVVLLQSFLWRITKCTRLYTDAFLDLTEFIFLGTLTLKFFMCMILGSKLLNYR